MFLLRDPLWRLYYRVNYLPTILRCASQQGLDPHLLAAVIFVESRFRPGARSDVGARGLMQLMPETAADVAQRHGRGELLPEQLDDPTLSIELGSLYYAELKGRFRDPERALAAYNAGPTVVEKWTDGKIPYSETRHFVEQVVSHRARLEQLYPEWDKDSQVK